MDESRRQFCNTALGAAFAVKEARGTRAGIEASRLKIVCGAGSSPEACAARELREYLRKITGVQIPLAEQAADGEPALLVGRTQAAARLMAEGKLSDPAKTNAEAYVVRSVGGGRVVLLGGTGLATLYAVHHYLSNCCGVGFFPDGDQVPRRALVPVEGIDLQAQPHFAERLAMNLTVYWYSTPWWRWEQWRAYIDWLIRARYNILSLWDTPGEDIVWRRVWKRFGVEIADASYSGPPYGMFHPIKYRVETPSSAAWQEGQAELARKIVDYARERGLRAVAPALSGIVPPEFHAAYPNEPLVAISWTGFARQEHLHPSNPLYQKVGRAFLEEYARMYGNDHLYWLENYLECEVHAPREVQDDVRRQIAGANFRVVDAVDPQGVGMISSWTYFSNPAAWPPELLKQHLAPIPRQRIRLLDQFADSHPLYKETDYFEGRPWHFGAVYAFASDSYLHGDVRLLERQLKDVAADPRARNCTGFYPSEETLGHNPFYFQFMARLGWNPRETSLQAFEREYARTRYGDSAELMLPVVEGMVKTVYGSPDGSPPLYWKRMETLFAFSYVNKDPAWFARLRGVLAAALKAAPALGASRLYQHDLNDLARQYLAERFNAETAKLVTAWHSVDTAAFERHAAAMDRLLGRIEELLGLDDTYWLSPLIRQARALPGAPPDIDRRARDILTSWGGRIQDYARRDYYELVRDYYRPRMRMFLDKARAETRLGHRGKLAPGNEYQALEQNWIRNGFPLVEKTANPGGVVALLKTILAEET